MSDAKPKDNTKSSEKIEKKQPPAAKAPSNRSQAQDTMETNDESILCVQKQSNEEENILHSNVLRKNH